MKGLPLRPPRIIAQLAGLLSLPPQGGGMPVVSNLQDLANLLDELQVKFTLSQGSLSCQEDEVTVDPNPQYSKMPLPAAARRHRLPSQKRYHTSVSLSTLFRARN